MKFNQNILSISSLLVADSRSRANGRTGDGTVWASRRGVVGSTGANGRVVSKVDTVYGRVSPRRHATRARGQVVSRMATDPRRTQMEVSMLLQSNHKWGFSKL